MSETTEMAQTPVYIIDMTKGTAELPDRVVPGKDAKVEAQPCGSNEWIELKNKPITLYLNMGQCYATDDCPHTLAMLPSYGMLHWLTRTVC